jgi:hypothetical protein
MSEVSLYSGVSIVQTTSPPRTREGRVSLFEGGQGIRFSRVLLYREGLLHKCFTNALILKLLHKCFNITSKNELCGKFCCQEMKEHQVSPDNNLCRSSDAERAFGLVGPSLRRPSRKGIQGYLAHKKPSPPRTLQ